MGALMRGPKFRQIRPAVRRGIRDQDDASRIEHIQVRHDHSRRLWFHQLRYVHSRHLGTGVRFRVRSGQA
jgi:hypothetical protein